MEEGTSRLRHRLDNSLQQGQTCGERILLLIFIGFQHLSRQIPGISCRSHSGIEVGKALSSYGGQRENHMRQPIFPTKRKHKSKASPSRGKASQPVLDTTINPSAHTKLFHQLQMGQKPPRQKYALGMSLTQGSAQQHIDKLANKAVTKSGATHASVWEHSNNDL